jgi:hypothetical protein
LKTAYGGPCNGQFIEFVDESSVEHRSKQVKAFDAVYKMLDQLFGGSNKFGCLGIAKIVLFLWKDHFRDDPLYKQTMSWLLLRGNEQKDWFPCDQVSDQTPLEGHFLGLHRV